MKKDKVRYTVYIHHVPNGKKYIGITSQNTTKRWQNGHGYDNQLFGRAVKKYGWDNIIHEVFMDGLDKETAKQWEMALIAQFHTKDPKYGYNQTEGGDTNSLIGTHISEEHKKAISEREKGAKNPRARAVICLETLKVYETATEAFKETGASKICDCCRRSCKHKTSGGYHWAYYENDKYNEYYSDLLKQYIEEEQQPHKMPESVKEKLMEIVKVRVLCVETGEIFDSLDDAAKAKNVQKPNICKCCRGDRVTTGGYHWRYVDKEII